jgi:rubredoxin
MQTYLCSVCRFIYDQFLGYSEARIPPDTAFAELPENWVCPICGAGKSYFISFHDSLTG